MKCALVTMQDAGVAYLTQYTWEQNQKLYCDKHQYPSVVIPGSYAGMGPGFSKILFLSEMMPNNQHIDWFLWIDSDALITNFDTKIEDVADDRYHFIISTYWNDINAGVFMIRNSPEGREYINALLAQFPVLQYHNWQEQQAMIETFYKYKDWIKVVPQRQLNAACFSDGAHAERPSNNDRLGTDGQWQPGDWIMHWPGQARDLRVALAQKYIPLVKNSER